MLVLQFFFSDSGLTVIIMLNRDQTDNALIDKLADVEIGFQASETNNLLVELFWIFGKPQMIATLLA